MVITSVGFSMVSTYRNKWVMPNKDSILVLICKTSFCLFLTMAREKIQDMTTWESAATCIMVGMKSHSPSKTVGKHFRVYCQKFQVFLFKCATSTLAKIRQDWRFSTTESEPIYLLRCITLKEQVVTLIVTESISGEENGVQSREARWKALPQRKNSRGICSSHYKPFSHSSLNKVRPRNETVKNKDGGGSKSLAASARICPFVGALGSHSVGTIRSVSERWLYQYTSTFTQSDPWLLGVPFYPGSLHRAARMQLDPTPLQSFPREGIPNCTAHLDDHQIIYIKLILHHVFAKIGRWGLSRMVPENTI